MPYRGGFMAWTVIASTATSVSVLADDELVMLELSVLS